MSAELVIYGPEQAPFVDKVIRAARLKKLPFELVQPESPEDYRRWNPVTGLLPVADIAGKRVIDSARILDAMDARWPEPPLTASDPKTAAQQRSLEQWAGATFFFYWEKFLRDRAAATESAAQPGPGLLTRLGILRRPEPAHEDRYGAEFTQRMEDVANFLGTRPWFYSDRIGRADLAVFGFFRALRANLPGSDDMIDRHANLADWYVRVEEATRAPQ